MTRKDIDNLFDFLGLYFPNSDKLHSERLREAWLFVLRPYSKKVVADAVAEHLRESKFFPDPQSIAVKCPPPGGETARRDDPKTPPAGWEKQRALLERFSDLKQRRREMGLPADLEQARQAGMTAEEWLAELDEASLGGLDLLLLGRLEAAL